DHHPSGERRDRSDRPTVRPSRAPWGADQDPRPRTDPRHSGMHGAVSAPDGLSMSHPSRKNETAKKSGGMTEPQPSSKPLSGDDIVLPSPYGDDGTASCSSS